MIVMRDSVTVNQNKWCSLFAAEDVEVINYALDLEDYIQRGYAHDITRQVKRDERLIDEDVSLTTGYSLCTS